MSVPKLTENEVVSMDRMHKHGNTPQQIIAKLQKDRAKKGLKGPGRSAVYNFLAGLTHQRGAKETRGRPSKMPARLVSTASAIRRRLINKANNQYIVTWGDIHLETMKELRKTKSLKAGSKMPSEDWLARQVRATTEVRARPPKRRLGRSSAHEKKRFAQAAQWRTYSKEFWYNGVHCYIDNKRYLLARTAMQKKLARAARPC